MSQKTQIMAWIDEMIRTAVVADPIKSAKATAARARLAAAPEGYFAARSAIGFGAVHYLAELAGSTAAPIPMVRWWQDRIRWFDSLTADAQKRERIINTRADAQIVDGLRAAGI